MNCKWCQSSNANCMDKCFECYYMGIVESMGCKIGFKRFDSILNRLDEINFTGYVLPNRVYFYEQCNIECN